MAADTTTRRTSALYARLRDSVADFTAEKAAATSLFETCVDVLERLPIVADPANYPAALAADGAASTPSTSTLRSRLVARQLEAVDALVRALEEALAGMDAAAATAARAAADGAELVKGPASTTAATATGAAPSPADAAAALADAARAMVGAAACARAAAGAVEGGGADVTGLKALLRTLKDAPCFDQGRVADAIDAVLAAEPAAC